MPCSEAGQQPRQATVGQGLGRGHPQPARKAAVATEEVSLQLQRLVFHLLGACRHSRAGFSRAVEAAGQPIKKLHAQPLLQRLQAPIGGGMVDSQRHRGLGEAGSALDRKDKAQGVPIIHVLENSRKGFLLSCKHHWQKPNELAGGRTPTLSDIEDRPGPLLWWKPRFL